MKIKLWNKVVEVTSSWNGPFCIMGDFNSTVAPEERMISIVDHQGIHNFSMFLDVGGLVYIPIQNKRFTWFGGDGKKSRIDRMVVNQIWLQECSTSILIADEKDESDHRPLIWG